MSTPMTMPMAKDPSSDRDRAGGADGSEANVAAYVATVRSHLDDLRSEELEELTGGLEADLTDELRDAGIAPVAMFGPPADYAAELRTAAGLAPRASPAEGRPGHHPDLGARMRDTRDQLAARLRGQRWWPPVRDFATTLRPVWWLLRAYIAYQWADHVLTDASGVLPYSVVTWLTLLAGVVVSVELGRRQWAEGSRGRRVLIATGNGVALLVMAFALVDAAYGSRLTALNRVAPGRVEVVTVPPEKGLFNGDYEVVNVFPYDKDGHPLRDVQLFDDRGAPLAPVHNTYLGPNGERVRLLAAVTANGRSGLNVFPLREDVINPGYDPQTGDQLPMPASGPLRNPALPDPTQPPVVGLPIPAASRPTPASSLPASPNPTQPAAATPSVAATG